MKKIGFTFLIFYLQVQPLWSATCSCAGIPLSASLNQSGLYDDQWNLSFSYNLLNLNDLVQGSDEITDETDRQRDSVSYLAQLSYAINDRWTVTGVGSYIQHSRRVGVGATEESDGLGDTVLAANYTPFRISPFSRYELSFGVGRKFTTGDSDNRSNGILLIEDMQPSTGAPSTYAWVYLAHSLSQAATHQLYTSLNYTSNGTNDESYQFGDETDLAVGYIFQGGGSWSARAQVNMLNARSHQRFDFNVPNTGGQWVNFAPSIQYAIKENLGASLSAQVPVSRDLDGALQFTVRRTINFGLNYQWQ